MMIQDLPRAFDAELGSSVAESVAGLAPSDLPLITGVAGSAPYLSGLIQKEASWLPEALSDPDRALAQVLERMRDLAPDQAKLGLRFAKRRVALLTALMDLSGQWTLLRVTGALTEFADEACAVAMRAVLLPLYSRGKLPALTEEHVAAGAGLSVLAMGKMGAYELNYSSDIDLIYLFDETQVDPSDFVETRATLIKAVRSMCAILSDVTDDGYVLRTDLRLRPDPSVTPVVVAMEAAERYYESLGRTWERAAFIKARPAAGDIAAGEKFLKVLTPFVWRRHLDFAAIQDAHDMRLAIREAKARPASITLPGHDMKLGRGGIREIEFFTQTQQLITGGRDPSLRMRGTQDGLAQLAVRSWVPEGLADTLSDHYVAHRTVEHRLQMLRDAQTHVLPRSDEGFARLAALLGREVKDLKSELHARLTDVHAATEGFFAPQPTKDTAPVNAEIKEVASRWPNYPALRSDRGKELFARLEPDIIGRLNATSHPGQAVRAFDAFLSGLPAGVQVFSLFAANPQLIDLIMDIVGTAPRLAEYLARNAGVLDAVIAGPFWSEWPGCTALISDLADALSLEEDYERQLDTARRWYKDWHFRIGVHHLRGLISAATAAAQYSDLAEAVVAALWPAVVAQFARKHGTPPGRGAMVLAMGSLGARQLASTSDLDLIVIYDPEDQETSAGPRPLVAQPYYARLTKAFVTALTVPTAEGKLYDVDLRLRPSGNQGPVATSWKSFQSYQREEAWVWEHLALTRARPVAGETSLQTDVAQFSAGLLGQKDAADVLSEVAAMRARIAAAKSPEHVLDAKIGPGRMQDIELFAQAATLVSGAGALDTASGLAQCSALGWIENDADLRQTYELHLSVHMAMKSLAVRADDSQEWSDSSASFLLRETGFDALEPLMSHLVSQRDAVAATLAQAIERQIPNQARP